MFNAKTTILKTIQTIIVNKLCYKSIITSSDVNREVLAIQQRFKKMPAPFKITKHDARKIFKHIKSRLVINGMGV